MTFAFDWRKASLRLVRVAAWALACIAIGYGCFALSSAHTNFLSDYHPDEPGKADQLMSGERNFFHPQLMLEAALLVLPADRAAMDPETVVRQARVVSAIFVAGAVLLLAGAGAAAGGRRGFFAVAITAGLCPPLIEAGHYLKEDASLVFGMAAVLCAGACFVRVRHAVWIILLALLLGAAAGIAASGKYCGVIFPILALLLVIARLWRRPFWLGAIAVILLLAAAAGVWSGINYRVFDRWGDFTDGVTAESRHITTGHRGVALDLPNPFFISVVIDQSPWPVLSLACIAPFAWLLQRRASGFGPWLIVCIAAYLLMLSYSVIPFSRYALPATVMTYALAGLGLAWVSRLDGVDRSITWRPCLGGAFTSVRLHHLIATPFSAGTVLYLAGGLVLICLLGARANDVVRQFADDSRDALRNWVTTSLPPGTRFVADDYTQLRGPSAEAPALRTQARVYHRMWAADIGSIAFLRQLGIQYIAVVSSADDRFFTPYTHGEPGDETSFARRRAFYQYLAANCPVVWQRIAAHPLHEFVNPDIRVYEITPAPTKH